MMKVSVLMDQHKMSYYKVVVMQEKKPLLVEVVILYKQFETSFIKTSKVLQSIQQYVFNFCSLLFIVAEALD